MTDEQKRELAGQIFRHLSGEADGTRETNYRGPLTPPAPNATQVQQDSYTGALLERGSGEWSEKERQHLAGEITACLRKLGW